MNAGPDDDRRARDVLAELPPRRVVGHTLVRRVGDRAWAPPRFASGRAVFVRLGLPDPWDPDAKPVDTGLGDVGMSKARQPAPHLTPPQPARPAAARPPGLPNVPAAPQRRESAGDAGINPALRIGEVRKADPSEFKPKADARPTRPQAPPPRPAASGAFGPGTPSHAVARLPIRPGVTVPGSEPAAGAALPPPASPAPAARPPAPPPPAPAAPAARPPAAVPSRAAPPRPTPAEPPAAPPPPPAVAPEPPAPRPAPAPVNRRPPGGTGGLDDLFGMGNTGDNTRIRMPKADPEGEAPRPKRTVTSPEELARLGFDRRPPRPENPTPASPAPPATRAEEPDE